MSRSQREDEVAPDQADPRTLPALARLAERLQAQNEELLAALETQEQRSASFQEQVAQLESRLQEANTRAGRAEELHSALAERAADLDAAAQERRHLQLDVVVKDAYIAELRAALDERLPADDETRLRSELERAAQEAANLDAALYQSHRALHEASEREQGLQSQMAALESKLAEFGAFHHRMADAANDALRRVPILHRLVGLAGIAARRRNNRRAGA